MNIPMSWLNDFVNISDIDLQRFVDGMTASGTKVEGVAKVGAELTNIVVGKVVSVKSHPAADKLRVFGVDVGGRELTIVSAAENPKEGDIVPVATDGAVLSGGKEIIESDLRGVISQGMMCSIEELGFSRQDYPEAPEDGIYIFAEEPALGADVIQLLMLREDVVEYEVTSNRQDCFSVVGIAREVAATFERKLNVPQLVLKEESSGATADNISVEIENTKGCPRYVARVVTDVKVGPSPLWLRNRLSMSGVRPINNIVDITNYVNLELGQPLHAFNIDCVDERKIIVRNAKAGEEFVTLDGVSRTLDPSMLVIADPNKGLAIAGVMGGENSKVEEDVTTVLFESACFDGPTIRATSAKLGLRTEASSKFEKGIDPNLALVAINRAAELVELLGCGKVQRGVVDVYPEVRSETTVSYSAERISRLLNVSFTNAQIEEYLARLGITAKNGVAQIPTFRQDLAIEADIAEEVARMFGYDNIPTERKTGSSSLMAGKKTEKQQTEDVLRETLAAYGLFEAISFSFESPGALDKLCIPQGSPLRSTIRIKNPLGEEYGIMRTQTVNAMLQSLSLNYNRRNASAWLFEIGKTYEPREGAPVDALPIETEMLTIGIYGNEADFFVLKGIVEGLVARVADAELEVSACTEQAYLHPGRAAKIVANGGFGELGYIGEVHPEIAENYEIGTRVYIATLNLTKIFSMPRKTKKYKQLPKFPGTSRDIAFVVTNDVTAAQMQRTIQGAAGDKLESVELFDVYTGEQVGEGLVSVAYRLFFRAADRTLVDQEVDAAMANVLAVLKTAFNAQQR